MWLLLLLLLPTSCRDRFLAARLCSHKLTDEQLATSKAYHVVLIVGELHLRLRHRFYRLLCELR